MAKRAKRFRAGTRVRLKPLNIKGGGVVPEQFGRVVSGPDYGVYIVELDVQYRAPNPIAPDDGLVEVESNQMELA